MIDRWVYPNFPETGLTISLWNFLYIKSTELASIYYITLYDVEISLQGMPRQLNTHQKDKPNNL